jgi:hypothetical protein
MPANFMSTDLGSVNFAGSTGCILQTGLDFNANRCNGANGGEISRQGNVLGWRSLSSGKATFMDKTAHQMLHTRICQSSAGGSAQKEEGGLHDDNIKYEKLRVSERGMEKTVNDRLLLQRKDRVIDTPGV